jgi:OmpA-OmpF porin, OOP family
MMFKATCAVALMCATAMAHAQDKYQDNGFQFGVALGQSGVTLSNEDAGLSRSAVDLGYKLYAGYRFNQYLALEGTWENSQALLDTDDGGTPPAVSTDDDLTLRVKPKVYGASVIGSLPFAEVYAAYARVGMSHWESAFTASLGDTSSDYRDKGDDLKWGVGIAGHLDGALLRLEYEQLDVTMDKDIPFPVDLKFRQITLGAVWLF